MERSIAVVVMSASRERLQLAGMTAAVAAVSGAAVRVFVSMNALPCFAVPAPGPVTVEGAIGAALATSAPPFERFFAEAAELGDAKVFPCSLAMELAGLGPEDLPQYFGPPQGITAFMADAGGAQVWTF